MKRPTIHRERSGHIPPKAPPPPPGRIVNDLHVPPAHREPTGAPPVSTEIAIVLGVLVTVLFLVYGMPWLIKASTAALGAEAQPATVLASRDAEDAKRLTAVVAACLNGQAITDGERIVDCKARK